MFIILRKNSSVNTLFNTIEKNCIKTVISPYSFVFMVKFNSGIDRIN